MLLWGPLYVTERTLRDSDHIGRMLGASLIYSPLSPGSPHAPQPWGPLCIPQEVLTVVLLACNEKPQAHVFTQLSASHRSSPRHLVPCQIWSYSVWVAGFHQEGAESSNSRRAAFGRSRSSGLALALQSPLLRCKHCADVLHMLFYLQSLPGWDLLRYELFPLNLCTTPGSQILQNYV